MAKQLKKIFDPGTDEVVQNFIVQSWHVSQSVDAFTGVEDYDIEISGSLTVTGSYGGSGGSGDDGTSGTSGAVGTSGTTGANGSSGTTGATGNDGTSGTSGGGGGGAGTSGTSANGSSGTSGATPAAGSSGTSGATPAAGSSGTSGAVGTSGTSGGGGGGAGISGTSGSGAGTSGTTGADGSSGTSGAVGTSGTTGENGSSGTSGSGTSGTTGVTGTSGTSGDGTSGTTGADGSSGTTGAAGTSGTGGGGSATRMIYTRKGAEGESQVVATNNSDIIIWADTNDSTLNNQYFTLNANTYLSYDTGNYKYIKVETAGLYEISYQILMEGNNTAAVAVVHVERYNNGLSSVVDTISKKGFDSPLGQASSVLNNSQIYYVSQTDIDNDEAYIVIEGYAFGTASSVTFGGASTNNVTTTWWSIKLIE